MRSQKYLILLFLSFQLFRLNAQQIDQEVIDLKWNDLTPIQLNDGKTISLPLVEGQFFDQNKVPTFRTIINVQNKGIVQEFQIKNVKFSSISGELLQHIDPQDIPNEIGPRFSIGRAGGNGLGILELNPLYKRDGKILKLESLTLEYIVSNGISSGGQLQSRAVAQKESSVLAQGTWHKFRIDTTGVFKIDRRMLQEIGIGTSGLDPRNIRIYGNGGHMLPQRNDAFRYDDLEENAILVRGEEDGNFDDDDYILFYGQGPDSWELNTQDFSLSRHRKNIYSDYAYYFITTDLGTGKRVRSIDTGNLSSDEIITNFHEHVFHETDEINLFANGQQWLGEDFSFQESQSFSFDLQNLDNTEQVYVRARAVALSSSPTNMTVSANGQLVTQLNFTPLSDNSFALASPSEGVGNTLGSGNSLTLDLTYSNAGNPSSKAYLDYIEIMATRLLVAGDKQMNFRNIRTSDPSQVYEFRISNAADVHMVWDVSDPRNPEHMVDLEDNDNYVFRTSGGNNLEYVFAGADNYLTPEAVENSEIDNQNLHNLQGVEYLIITKEYLMEEASRLAQFHESNSGLSAAVVELDKIYNEFGSGSPDITAIRDFIRSIYNKPALGQGLRYVCLFGDASFDFKNRIVDNSNVVPAFQSFESFNLVTSYVTDDYFGMMDENEGELGSTDLLDLAVGRFPVTEIQDARISVDKTLSYYDSSSNGDWRNTITFVADDPDEPNEFVLQQTVDLIAQELESGRPEFNLKKIYADAYQQVSSAGGERYPDVNDAIDNAIESGTLVMDYFGHGGVNGWANERILEVQQVQGWNNKNALPLLITVTCEFARFDNPLRPTAGEYALLNPDGGTTNMISTSREIFISVGQSFNRTLFQKLFGPEGNSLSISEALMLTKREFGSIQRLFVYSFGDPAMPLATGKPDLRITRINDKDIETGRDTLKALSRISLEGVVTDANGNTLNDFNGTLQATIFDKALEKTTLDNDNFGRKMNFSSIESKVFRGRATVTDGNFSFDFIVPKDIRIAYGKAKISMYAENPNGDRSGADLDVTIGGIDPNAPEDNEGPLIQLFMNDESFVDGGNTNESPVLYAILEDSSGINTSITSVDHDIVAILDDDQANPYVLNDYYETDLDDFTKGKVKFPFRELEPGLHTVKFKCWDTYNNPSETTLSFIVVNDNDLILSNVLNYPNPFVNYTEFWFNHNKPNEPLEVQVQIFTVSGKLIRTLNRSVQSEGLLSREITWDGLDDFGNKIGKGVYVYKLHVRSLSSQAKAEKFEKLVILQ